MKRKNWFQAIFNWHKPRPNIVPKRQGGMPMSDRITFRKMTVRDIENVLLIERQAFTSPWSRNAFYGELTENHFARYIVMMMGDEMIGYGGMWIIIDEAHVTNVAVVPAYHGKKLGERLFRHLMAEAIRTVAGLYHDGILKKPANYAYPFPDVLTFHDAPTVIEQKLFVMMMEHRMRAFQGSFHSNPDYATWYGWSEMQRDLTEINELAAQMRQAARAPASASPAKQPVGEHLGMTGPPQ